MTATDEPDGHTHNGSRADAEPARTVAQEAALLVELLSRRGWGAGGGMPSASSHTTAHEQPGAGSSSAPRAAADGAGGSHDGAATDSAGAGARPGGIPLTDARQAPECTCGGREPAACRVCPVCQIISFVQQVNPDTIERVADFVGFAATALRDLATAQRERSTRPGAAGDHAAPDPPAREDHEGPA
ncbi:hypothetical protein [Humibacillus xanthopallidus]|uniref:Uncharacterized protein n=1 Tax=Humibacillus xanthopallidus TaxID=412689 RepID=A0A543HXB8_9MICO|nr:hypothetical protein [Humibacillus xanthopallidus]TQM63003.1 hypothetical protein FBY41_3048 [Humibacillus xanthopallidus]